MKDRLTSLSLLGDPFKEVPQVDYPFGIFFRYEPFFNIQQDCFYPSSSAVSDDDPRDGCYIEPHTIDGVLVYPLCPIIL